MRGGQGVLSATSLPFSLTSRPLSPTSHHLSLENLNEKQIRTKIRFSVILLSMIDFLKFVFLKWSLSSFFPFPFLLKRKIKSLKLFIHILFGGISFLPFYKFLLSHFPPLCLPHPAPFLPPPSPPPISRPLFSHLPCCCAPPHGWYELLLFLINWNSKV